MKQLLHAADPGFDAAFDALLHQTRETTARVDATVAAIIEEVRQGGDAALCSLTARFDDHPCTADRLRIEADEIDAATHSIPPQLMAALDHAARRIEAFHAAQMPQDLQIPGDDGLQLGMRWTPLDSVGLYVPGGKAAYPSSVLMNALPARAAGVKRIAMCVPCPGGALNPLVLAAAQRAGVTEIYRIGGAQAIAALAYGTATIAPVDRVVGPGNAYVAEAKRQVFGRVGIDSIAGPSEVVVIADADNNPRHIALDLLAQAEHDEAAQSILITDCESLAHAVAAAVEAVLPTLPRAAIAGASWHRHGAVIVTRDLDQATELANRLAPEHLQIMVRDPQALFARIRHAGAAFLGRHVPEALGDYIAGPNHVLPTGRTSRFASGLSVFDFLKRTTWIEASEAGLRHVGSDAVLLAEAEGLQAHAQSIEVRLKGLQTPCFLRSGAQEPGVHAEALEASPEARGELTRFYKMHGLGNDFAVFDARHIALDLTPARIAALADRRAGIGCDQLIVIEASRSGADAFMRIFNADGSQAGACGNATRCVAALLAQENGRIAQIIETVSGPLPARLLPDGCVEVDMGPPRLGWQDIPLARAVDTMCLPLSGEPAAVSMGNPHATLFVPDAEAYPVERIGPILEHDPLFPNRANIGFAQILAPDRIRLRVWERGAGLTRACGSGACAALVNAHRLGLAQRQAELVLDGGSLSIAWREQDSHVLMTGPAATVYEGEIDISIQESRPGP